MKHVATIVCAFVLVGCTGHEPVPILTFLQLHGEAQGLSGGTETVSQLHHHSNRDSLIGQTFFGFYGTDHVVRAWRDDHYADIDGGSYWLELDTLGRIYSHSTVWPGFMVVRTNNDSINELISLAIGAASRPYHLGIRDAMPRVQGYETVNFIVGDTLSE